MAYEEDSGVTIEFEERAGLRSWGFTIIMMALPVLCCILNLTIYTLAVALFLFLLGLRFDPRFGGVGHGVGGMMKSVGCYVCAIALAMGAFTYSSQAYHSPELINGSIGRVAVTVFGVPCYRVGDFATAHQGSYRYTASYLGSRFNTAEKVREKLERQMNQALTLEETACRANEAERYRLTTADGLATAELMVMRKSDYNIVIVTGPKAFSRLFCPTLYF